MPAMPAPPRSELDYTRVSLDEFTRALASAEPVPGGGSAAAVAGSLAASLVAMVARLSMDRPRYADHADLHAEAAQAADALRARMLRLAELDAAAYAGYVAARRLPRETPEQRAVRDSATREAARHATEIPGEVVREGVAIIGLARDLVGRSNEHASSDLLVAALLANAAATGAAANVRVNLAALGTANDGLRLEHEIDRLLSEAGTGLGQIRDSIASGSMVPSGS
jgi:formiminotetrahydrofolate cyclodeaminase